MENRPQSESSSITTLEEDRLTQPTAERLRLLNNRNRSPPPHMLYNNLSLSRSSSGETPKHSKEAVAQALEKVRRLRVNSPTGQQSTIDSPAQLQTRTPPSLNIPTLQESRNDQERRRVAQVESLVDSKSQEGQFEVSLKPPPSNHGWDEYGQDGSQQLSPNSVNKAADQIILEAEMASSHLTHHSLQSLRTGMQNSHHLIKEALEKAALKTKEAATDAVSAGSAIIRSDPGAPTIGGLPRLRTTREVLQMATATLREKERISNDNGRGTTDPGVGEGISNFSSGTASPHLASPVRDPYAKIPPCLSPSESVGSIDDFEKAVGRLPSRLKESDKLSRDKILQRIDGVKTPPTVAHASPKRSNSPLSTHFEDEENSIQSNSHHPVPTKTIKVIKSVVAKEKPEEPAYGGWLSYLLGGGQGEEGKDDVLDGMAPLSCGTRRAVVHDELPAMATSLVRVMSDPMSPPYAEAVTTKAVDLRMPDWIENQFSIREDLPSDGTYQLGESRTVIVHEVMRGNWTWTTAWSPDGNRLAVATDNHHLTVIDTSSSSVWRVRHDKKVRGPPRKDVTHSIRSIAWGNQFIAIGGTGNTVSILAPIAPYPVLHTFSPTGFVGSLHWRTGTNTLLVGSRLGKALVVRIWAEDKIRVTAVNPRSTVREIQSTILYTIDRQKAWVNAVKFSPGGSALAVGDSKGILGIYSYTDEPGSPVSIENVANFKLEDAILDVEWSPDGQWLYAGGEDFTVTVISTQWWEPVHRIKRNRWVQFISSSKGGSHVAIGGVSSEVTILDVDRGWDTAINVSLKGLVPLSAKWHPQDQYLVLTGQNNSILAIETTNARYVSGHFLRSVSPILAIEFSPDGRMTAIGNEAGVVTIFKLSGTTFISTYELVLDCNGSLSIKWSLNGSFLTMVAGNKLVVVTRKTSNAIPDTAPPNSSGFSVAKVVRDLGPVHAVSIDPQSRYVAVSGTKTTILDATTNFKCVKEIESIGVSLANSWSPDGTWFATIGKKQGLLVYDASPDSRFQWKVVFSVQTKLPGLTLTWGPSMPGGLQYCAYGGEDKKVCIMEIRTKERTWETVLGISRDGVIYDLDWNNEGLVAAAVGNGTVTIIDLSYLQSGYAVSEMDYNWQRQALTCFTEIRRNKGKNSMRSVRWIPSAPGSDSLLAVGGTDGELEIVDLTERQRCSGFFKDTSS